MATENIEKETKELKAKAQEGKIIVGTEKVLKRLRENKIKKIFLASNCPAKIKDDINHYAKLAKIPVIELNLNNEELGLFCKKNFFVAVLGITEE